MTLRKLHPNSRLLRILAAVWLALLFVAAPATASTNHVAGTVYEQQDGQLIPLANARVRATSEISGQVLAATKTDRRGRYQLVDLRDSFVSLTASRTGYFTNSAGGVDDSKIVVDCSSDGECSELDFQLLRGAVVSGLVTDEFHEPLQRVRVALRPTGSGPNSGASYDRATDDRGVFRIAGVRPGRYELLAAESAASYPHDVSYQAQTRVLEVEARENLGGLQLVMHRVRRFRVSGVVRGVDLSAGAEHRIEAVPLVGPSGDSALTMDRAVAVEQDGTFRFWSLPAGNYIFHIAVGGDRSQPRRLKLGTVVVDRDLTALLLEPLRPGSIAGLLKTDPGIDGRRISLFVAPMLGGESRFLSTQAPDYEFQLMDLTPGEYTLQAISGQYFVKSLDGEARDRTIHVREGETTRLEVTLSSEFARVTGRLKQPRGSENAEIQAASHYRVGLAGENRIRSVQADQNGRFRFDKVVPGEYRIGAWHGVSEAAVQQETLWEQARSAVRTFPVDANAEIEIELTAAP